MAEKGLTAKYIHSHMGSIHTAESWGRSIAEQVCRAAQDRIGKEGAQGGSVTVDAKFTITAIGEIDKPTCMTICTNIAGVNVCFWPCWHLKAPLSESE